MLSARKRLGLAVTEEGITAVEIAVAGSRKTVLRTAELPFSGELNLSAPEKLGKELKQALRQNGLSASRCVIGLAATWIVSRGKPLPAMDAESLRGALSIAAERDFASGVQDLSFDYCAWPSGGGLSSLLAAAPRKVMERVLATVKAAGLSAKSMTCSAIALAHATRQAGSHSGRVILCLLSRGVELVVDSPGGVRLIRHLPVRPEDSDVRLADLSRELRRILALAPADQASEQGRELCVWDCLGIGASWLKGVASQLGLPLRVCTASGDLGLSPVSPSLLGERFAQAAALACRAGEAMPIDFLNSRLAPPRKAKVGRRARLAIIASVAVLVAGAYFLLDWHVQQREVLALRSQLGGLGGSVAEAKALVDKVSFARGWYDRRPPFLDCLREITQAFPQEGRIWATGLTIRQDMEAVLTGKSASESAVLDVLDRLKSNPALSDVKPLYIRQAGGTSRDVSFAIGLRLKGPD